MLNSTLAVNTSQLQLEVSLLDASYAVKTIIDPIRTKFQGVFTRPTVHSSRITIKTITQIKLVDNSTCCNKSKQASMQFVSQHTSKQAITQKN